MARALDAELTGAEPVHHLELPYRFAPDRTLRVGYVLLDRGAGRCR